MTNSTDINDKNVSNGSEIKSTGKCPFSHLKSVNEDESNVKSNEGVTTDDQTEGSIDRLKEEIKNGKIDSNSHTESNDNNGSNDANECDVKKESNDNECNDKNESNEKKDSNNDVNDNNDASANTNDTANADNPRILFEDIPLNRQPVILPGGIIMPSPRVESVNSSWKTQHLTAEQINDYCKTLFKFKTVNIMHFK